MTETVAFDVRVFHDSGMQSMDSHIFMQNHIPIANFRHFDSSYKM